MSEVKRWAAKTANDLGSVVFIESPNGRYVTHEDYAEEKHRADQNAGYLETLTTRMLFAEKERDQAALTHDYQHDQINYWNDKSQQQAEENAALQQKLDAVLAENAKLMSGFSFFMYSDDSGFETYKTEAEAIAAANEMIGCCREDAASDGWPEETETIRWGVIRQQAVECDYQKASEENGWMGWCDYKLSPETPVTDAILNEVRADGAISVRDALVLAEEGNDLYAIATQTAAQLRAGSTEGGV